MSFTSAGRSGSSERSGRISADPRGRHAVEEDPRHGEADPDDEAEEAHDVDERQAPDALLAQLREVRHQADGENVITKKSTRKTLVSALASLAASRSPGRVTTSPSSAVKVTK